MKETIGTSYFPSTQAAQFYYSRQHPYAMPKEIAFLVEHKKEVGEIIIGKPQIKENQELKIIDNRYHICE